MTILQLNPPIPLRHITKGDFLAHIIHDPGIENEIMFTGCLNDSGEIWTFRNRDLRFCTNLTIGRDLRPVQNEIKQEVITVVPAHPSPYVPFYNVPFTGPTC